MIFQQDIKKLLDIFNFKFAENVLSTRHKSIT